MLTKYKLNSDAFAYVKDCLDDGHALSKKVLNACIDGKGEFLTFLPPNISLVHLMDFESGYVTDREASVLALTEFLMKYMGAPGRPFAVFDDPLASPDDPGLKGAEYQFFTFQSNVYHFLGPRDATTDKIIHAITSAGSYPFIGVLTSLPSNEPDVVHRQEVGEELLEALAIRTRIVVVGAYDDEGHLIYIRESNTTVSGF